MHPSKIDLSLPFLLNKISHFFSSLLERRKKKRKFSQTILLDSIFFFFQSDTVYDVYTVVNSPSRDIRYEITVYRHAINTVSRILRHVFTPCFGLDCSLHAFLTSSSSNEQITVTGVEQDRWKYARFYIFQVNLRSMVETTGFHI